MPASRTTRRLLVLLIFVAVVYYLPRSKPKPSLHIAVIADDQRLDYAAQVIRSAVHFTRSHRIHAHLIAPRPLHSQVTRSLAPISKLFTLALYNYDYCLNLATTLRPYSDASIHTSALCKIFLDHIIPEARVLYMDSDASATADLSKCYTPTTGGNPLYSMAVDLGDTCQLFPQRCWPLSYLYRVPEGLVCGNFPERYVKSLYTEAGAQCIGSGELEAAQLNGGVVLFELEAMRKSNFTERFLSSVTSTWLEVDKQSAKWGDQEFLNNFARYYPNDVGLLHCGCNYQWQGYRKEIKCGGQPVTVAHGWSSGISKPSREPYNRLFYYFLNNPEGLKRPPVDHPISAHHPLSQNESATIFINQDRLRPHA